MKLYRRLVRMSRKMGWIEVILFSLMTFTIIIICLVVSKIEISNSITPNNSNIDEEVTELTPNHEKNESFNFQNVEFKNQIFSAFILDTRKHKISFFLKNEHGQQYGTIRNLETQLKRDSVRLEFATNAGIFKENFEPEGLFINEGQVIAELNLNDGIGNFYLKPNGVFYILDDGTVGISESYEFASTKLSPLYATQSGPILLYNGEMNKAFNKGSTNLFTRSGVGIISPYRAVFLLSSEPVNYFDFSSLFKTKFNCKNALYLDGAISEMYVATMKSEYGERRFSGIIGITD